MKNLTIKLYHFTNRNNIEIILANRILEAGRHVMRGKIEHKAICFTSDPDPGGHGLTDGRQISTANVLQMRYATEENGSYYCVDNTEFCIAMPVRIAPALVKATKLHKPKELLGLAIAGHLPCSPNPTDVELVETWSAIKSGTLKDKSPTWWYHFGDLNLTDFEVSHKQKDHSYARLQVDTNGQVDLASIPAKQIFSYS
ncbi:hypothetical protein [Ralstonia solanacearum]|uniref:DarT domain-containing protein n=1 Tax=Ralstonia solanacearum TaxID=305 RepID=A0AAE3NK24_RALSL|nr:hypothetical protein [Ralstonia solanacearum]MBB6581561.1 hypothetical protein [Ralstonia solanacearum]MDB0524687.1 hypothetical protein [Ralstonia solanacearum]